MILIQIQVHITKYLNISITLKHVKNINFIIIIRTEILIEYPCYISQTTLLQFIICKVTKSEYFND